MNVADYGQGVKYAGIDALQRLANLEDARIEAYQKLRDQDSQSRAAAIGGMAGTVIGAGKGFLADREAKHKAKQAAEMDTWRDERLATMMGNSAAGRELGYNLPAPPVQHDYSAWDDLLNGFKDSDLGD